MTIEKTKNKSEIKKGITKKFSTMPALWFFWL